MPVKIISSDFAVGKANSDQFRVTLPELALDPSHIEKMLGYRPGQTPALYRDKIGQVLEESRVKADIQAGFVELPEKDFQCTSHSIRCCQLTFKTGKIIASQLKGSTSGVLFAGTAGPVFEHWSKKLFEEGDFPGGYVVDVVGSEMVEAAIDWLENKIWQKVNPRGLQMTNRFSPGYCGWQVKEQFKLFSLLPPNFCGISLTPSALMVPIKSVSGIIGIGPGVRKVGYPCDVCNMINCYRRRNSQPT